MDDHQLAEFKRKLDENWHEIAENLAQLKISSKPVDLKNPIGRLSRMDAIQQQQISLRAKENAELTLRQIEEAKKRIGDKSYGICLNCEENIGLKRLKARPWALLCRSCQK